MANSHHSRLIDGWEEGAVQATVPGLALGTLPGPCMESQLEGKLWLYLYIIQTGWILHADRSAFELTSLVV